MANSIGTQLTAAGGSIPRGYAAGSLPKYTPEQLDLFKSLFSHVGPESQLARQAGGEEAGFEPFEEAGRRAFQEYSGDLASRFSGMGLGARKGSGFKNMASQSAQDFALSLAQQRQALQRQALQDLMSQSQMLLGQEPNENFLVEERQKQPSIWKQLLGIGLPVAGGLLGAKLGGVPGAKIGGRIGGLAASNLSNAWQNVEY